jgi:hypothetical protein
MVYQLIFVVTAFSGQPNSVEPPALSIEQTIALCLSSPKDEGDRQYQKAANPKAKEVVYRLTKSKFPLVRHRSIGVLGYIGNEEDVAFLGELVRSEGSAKSPDKHVFTSTSWALTTLARRRIPKSEAMLKSMASPEFWDSPDYASAKGSLKGNSYFADHTWLSAERLLIHIMDATEHEAFCRKNHAKIEDKALREYADAEMAPERFAGARGLMEKQEKLAIDVEKLRRLDAAFDAAPQELREEGQLPKRSTPLLAAAKAEHGDGERKLGDEKKAALAEEAGKNYSEITKQILATMAAQVVDKVTNPSHLMTSKELQEHRNELVENLNDQGAKTLQRIGKLGLKKENVTVEYVSMKTPSGKSSDEVIRVRWRLTGPRESLKTLTGLIFSPDDKSPDGKALQVTMFFYDGKWYWKPFGW